MKRFIINFSIILLAAAMVLESCGEDKALNPELSVSPTATAIVFAADGKSATSGGTAITPTFTVTTNQGSWEASSNQAWLHVTKSGNTFTLSADANTNTSESAPAIVTVTAGKASSATISVTRMGASPYLSIEPEETTIVFAADGAGATSNDEPITPTFTVTTNAPAWDAVSDQSWLHVEKTGNGFTLTADANTSPDAPEPSTVTVPAGEATPVKITVTQRPITKISVEESKIWLICGTEEFKLTVTTSAPIAFELPGWIQLKTGNPSETGTQEFTFIASAATNSNEDIIVKAVDGSAQVPVPVSQEFLNIKAMTFNVRVYSPLDGSNNWPNRKDVAARIIMNENVDIVGTQEMTWSSFAKIYNDLKERLPDYGSYAYGRDENPTTDEHIGIFYKKERFDLIHSGHFWLSLTPDVKSRSWDARYNRIAVWTILEEKTSKRRFFAINTHLDNEGSDSRSQAVRMILPKIISLSEGLPVVLTGDFNDAPHKEPINYITYPDVPNHVLGARDIATVKTGTAWTFHGFGQTEEANRICIDYIFVNQNSKVDTYNVLPAKLNDIYLSDHCPVTAGIRLATPPGPK